MKVFLCLVLIFGLSNAIPHERSLTSAEQAELDDENEMVALEKQVEAEQAATEPHWVDAWMNTPVKPSVFFDIKNWDELEEKSNSGQAVDYVRSKIQVYYSVDPSHAMKKLAEVGSLLRLAYAGSKGFKCSSSIIKLLSSYQDLIKDSLITSSTFVEIVLTALRYHKVSMTFIEHKKVEKSLKYLKKCATMANRMAEESQILIDKSDALVKLATDALVEANEDYVGTVEERKRIQKLINDLKVEEAKQKAIKADLAMMIAEAKEEERRNAAAAREKENWGMIMDIFSPLANVVITTVVNCIQGGALGDEPKQIMEVPKLNDDGGFPGEDGGFPGGEEGGLGPGGGGCAQGETQDILPKGDRMHELAKVARDREAVARKTRIDFQQKQLDNNAELAQTVQKLMNNKESKDQLDKAIYGLDITIKTLGKVKTIFLNAKVFWVGVKKHVESLSATQEELEDYAEEEDLRDEYVEAVVESGYSWLAVGKICRMSALKIREVDKGVDEIMNDLPTEAEAKVLIETLGAQIIADIKDENKDIKKEIKAPHNKLPLPKTLKLPITDPSLPNWTKKKTKKG